LIPKKKPGRKPKITKMAELANQNNISLLKDGEIITRRGEIVARRGEMVNRHGEMVSR
jgi:hypothetical protein